jgi:predicted pyridoxine 5'-phosphate oxidase superfamily flavin-nucleotide-binding protein
LDWKQKDTPCDQTAQNRASPWGYFQCDNGKSLLKSVADAMAGAAFRVAFFIPNRRFFEWQEKQERLLPYIQTMNLTPEIKQYIDQSVLCWLATSAADHQPNVSPKEIFTWFGEDSLIIANIASPQTVRNIRQQPNVCISFIDILVQKGYQLKGVASIVEKGHSDFAAMEQKLLLMTGGLFPFSTITQIKIEQAKAIIAPRYLLYPDTTEAQQIESARRTYGL